ncbi:MAG TPA: hypothetical protein VKR58_11915 [Aquella sp.]|nr:hypothetical protein [Aquella sp.]
MNLESKIYKPDNKIYVKAELLGSLRLFTEYFYFKRTGREFYIPSPPGRESHYITVFRELVKVHRLETLRLLINIPPGHGKSTMLQHFVAWAMAHYPDSQILYISYSKMLAEKNTAIIKQIIEMPAYRNIFDIELDDSSSAKGHFKTTAGGAVMAFGASGSVTGQDAGLPNLDRFSGMVVIDDAHKPDEVHSDLLREGVIKNYNETVKPRPRGPKVPIVFIGQRLHEDDLPAYLIAGKDGDNWDKVVLKALDEAGNALSPNLLPREKILKELEVNSYMASAQYQQDPIPAGGALYKKDWFLLLEESPDIKATFITCDTAETDKTYNDATVFSFWGLYKVTHKSVEYENLWALHWLDCIELRIEPKDLEPNFLDFYSQCMRFRVKPRVATIEKKSTGTTLYSVLKSLQGIRIIPIERAGASQSKTNRFLRMQRYIGDKLITLPSEGHHTQQCINHMIKITANSTHRWDDIADTVYDAVSIGLIDRTIINSEIGTTDYKAIGHTLLKSQMNIDRLKKAAYER